MHPFIYNKIYRAGEDGSGGGGGAVPQQQGNNQNNNNNNQNNSNQGNQNSGANNSQDQNNDGDFNLDKDNIWVTDDNKGGNNQPQNNQQQEQPDPLEGFNKFVEKKNFNFDIADDARSAFQQGDWKGFQDAFQTSAKNLYREVMLDAGRMVNASVSKALEQAQTNTNNTLNVQSMRSTLQRIVPISKNSNVAPIAEAMMSQFVKKGQDHETAATNVQKVLNTMRNIKSSDLGINEPPRSNNYRNGRSVQMNDDDANDIDWMSFAKSNQ